MVDELLILHGLQGGSKMATSYFDSRTGTYKTRRKRPARRVSGLGSLGSFGQVSSLKGTLAGVKGVLITGGIAAGGAIVTQQIVDKVAKNWEIAGWKRDLAQIGTGIALGILIAKVFKKPKLAAAFAIGPVVAGAMKIFGEVMHSSTAGLGFNAYTPVNAFESMYAPLYGANVGVNTYQPVGASAPGVPPPPPSLGNWAYGATV